MSHQIFACPHRVTYAECTVGNHVYYARYLDQLEFARGEFFRSVGFPLASLQAQGILFPVIEARLRYRRAARYDDELRIELWLTECRPVKIAFAARILHSSGELLIEASTLHACTNLAERPIRVPADLTAALAPFLAVTV